MQCSSRSKEVTMHLKRGSVGFSFLDFRRKEFSILALLIFSSKNIELSFTSLIMIVELRGEISLLEKKKFLSSSCVHSLFSPLKL